jgi:hypothetical protein
MLFCGLTADKCSQLEFYKDTSVSSNSGSLASSYFSTKGSTDHRSHSHTYWTADQHPDDAGAICIANHVDRRADHHAHGSVDRRTYSRSYHRRAYWTADQHPDDAGAICIANHVDRRADYYAHGSVDRRTYSRSYHRRAYWTADQHPDDAGAICIANSSPVWCSDASSDQWGNWTADQWRNYPNQQSDVACNTTSSSASCNTSCCHIRNE